MVPDFAGGATFGLILHYMAFTAGDDANFAYALKYLEKLCTKYDKKPDKRQRPQQSVRQLLGRANFEQVLEEATIGALEKRPGVRNLQAAKRLAQKDRSARKALGVALFHDGAYRRVQGDEAGCLARMKEVFDLGFDGEPVRWYLARYELDRAVSVKSR